MARILPDYPETRSTGLLCGQALIDRVLDNIDFMPVVQTAVIDGQVASPQLAFSALEAFLQWFSLLPRIEESDNYVMLKGDVDQLWHAAIVNTVIYRKLCEDYIGKFVDHQPSLETPKYSWILGTVSRLEKAFGSQMHPIFREWLLSADTH
ncbi:MAG TPA: hypothetical protein VG890_15500 [Puia sp.]|nr:hypothetical protein [Puia sp.]